MQPVVAQAFFGYTFFQILLLMSIAFLAGFALLELFTSTSRGWVKAVWALAILCFPVVGGLAYLSTAPARVLDHDPLDRPGITPENRADVEFEMTHRPLT